MRRRRTEGGQCAPKLLIFAGVALIALGLLWMLGEGFGVSLGRLPDDFVLKRGDLRIYVPLATSLPQSVAASLLARLINR